MHLSCFQIDEALQLTPVAAGDAATACQSPDATAWLDFQGAEPGELESWLDKLEVSGLSRQLCLEARDRTGFHPLKKEMLFVIPAQVKEKSSIEVEHIAFLCRENFLLTLHENPVPILQRFAAAKESDAWLSGRSIAALVSAMFIALSEQCLQRTYKIKASIQEVESRMEKDPDTVEIAEILAVQSELRELNGVVDEQFPCAQALRTTDRPFFKLEDAQDYMNCATANLQAADKSVDRLAERIAGLRIAFDTNARGKTNHRLAILTVLSAIFMPISFLVGFWGMNFDMPEMKLSFAYPAAIGFMALIALGLYLFFRKNGWFE